MKVVKAGILTTDCSRSYTAAAVFSVITEKEKYALALKKCEHYF
jgi:hypothetical protein